MSRLIMQKRNTYFYMLAPLLVYILKAIILMQGGALYGHLAIPPPYDDVTYFVDAMDRVRIFFNKGLFGFVESLISNSPHAPYSTIAATLAFLFGGPSLVGPYIANGVMAALLSALLFRMFRMSASTTWCICIVLVTTAWFDNLVTTFHPDLISGFGAAIVAVVLIWQSDTIQRRTHAILTGTAGGLILLIKPVAFGMLLILWALAFLIGAALAYREEKSARRVGMRLLFGVLPLLVIAAPYFVHELGSIVDYTIEGFVRERGTWAGGLAPSVQALFYFNSARAGFEYWFFVAGGGALGIVVLAAFTGDGRTSLRFGGLMLLSFVAYLIPASLEVKSYFFGGVFYGCIAVCLILVIHFLADRLERFWSLVRQQRFGLTESVMQHFRAVALILIGLFAVAGLADKQARFPAKTILAVRAEYNGVYRLLREVLAGQDGVLVNASPPLCVYFPCPAPVSPHAYRFRALLDGLDIGLEMSPHQSDLQELVDLANRATVIVVPDDESLKSIYPYPVNKVIPAFRTWLDQSTIFKRIGTVRTSLGGTDVFANVSVADGTTSGFQSH
jgi:hypothetical protein